MGVRDFHSSTLKVVETNFQNGEHSVLKPRVANSPFGKRETAHSLILLGFTETEERRLFTIWALSGIGTLIRIRVLTQSEYTE